MDKTQIKKLIEEIKKENFISDYQASDEECFGLLIARFYHWDGIKILKTFGYALEDSNLHKEATLIDDLLKNAEKNYS